MMLYMVTNHGKEPRGFAVAGARIEVEPGRYVFLGLERAPKVDAPLMVVPMENYRQMLAAKAKRG